MYFEFNDFIEAYLKLCKWVTKFPVNDDPELLYENQVLINFSNITDTTWPDFDGLKYIKRLSDYNMIYPEGEHYYERELKHYTPIFIETAQKVMGHLKKDPYSRKCVLSFWDDIYFEGAKAPCNTEQIFKVTNNRLNVIFNMRANDAYKIALINFHSFYGYFKYIADSLGLETGTYYHTVSSFHVYKDSENAITELVKKIELL
jgi:thymidylate synthase